MKALTKFAGAVTAAFMSMATVANAAPLSVIGGDADVLPPNFSLAPDAGMIGDPITRFDMATKAADNGVFLDTRSIVTFTFLGFEAGFTNDFVLMMDGGGPDIPVFTQATSVGATAAFDINAGFVPFSFLSTTLRGEFDRFDNAGMTTDTMRLGVGRITDTSATLYFDDKFTDVDFDDLAVKISVVPVPVPASLGLLMAALAGVGMLARRSRVQS